MKAFETLCFWTGGIIIIFFAALQLSNPGFPASPLIILVEIFCIWQWHRHTRKLKSSLAQEQRKRQAADQYINALIPKGKKKR